MTHTALLATLPGGPGSPDASGVKRWVRGVAFGLQAVSVPAHATLLAAGRVASVDKKDAFESLLAYFRRERECVSVLCCPVHEVLGKS